MLKAREQQSVLASSGRDAAIRQVLYDLASLSHSIDEIREIMAASLGVSSRQYSILLLVAEYEVEGGATISLVSVLLHVSDAFVASEVTKLVEAGLVEKRPHPQDRRSQLLGLTPEASRRIAAQRPAIEALNSEVFGEVTQEQFQALASCLETLRRTAGAKADALGLTKKLLNRRRLLRAGRTPAPSTIGELR